MSTWIYREDSGYDEQFSADTEEDACAYAAELLRDADYGPVTGTLRVHAWVTRVMSWACRDCGRAQPLPGDPPEGARCGGCGGELVPGEESGRTRLTACLQPEEPACTSPAHAWRHESAAGHGGGVISTGECVHCGTRVIRDTWAPCRDCGEVYDSVRYEQASAGALA